jgi:hypothetical protein
VSGGKIFVGRKVELEQFKKIGMKPEIEWVQRLIHGPEKQVKSKKAKGKR